MPKNGIAATLVAALLVAALAVPIGFGVAGADDGDDEGPASELTNDVRRVEVEQDEEELEIRSIGPEGDRIRARLKADDAEIRFDFTPPEANETEVELQLTFERLVEYRDANGNGRFDSGDEVIQEVEVDDLPFQAPVVEFLDNGARFEVAYGGDDFALRLVFWAFGNETSLNGVLVRPTEVKFDIHVENFPFSREESGLAAVLELKTEVEPRHEANATVESLEAVAGRYEAFFAWATWAEVDGQTVPVNATVLKVETELEEDEFEVERTVALAYPRGALIVHDPVLGVAPASISVLGLEPGTIFLALGVGLSAAALAGLLLAARRRE